ncbi:MAG TPA: hypothetical protein VN442_26705 [Bryobacteraceae bacterium]|nr:hypothetical protein [Bryobacteraceae bacterium]
MNEIQEIAITPGELRFGWLPTERPQPGDTTRPRPATCSPRVAGEKLEGTFELEGEARPAIRWVGVRAPVIPDKDDGSWKEGKPVRLFSGKDLSGWKTPAGDPLTGWSVRMAVSSPAARAQHHLLASFHSPLEAANARGDRTVGASRVVYGRNCAQ